MDTCGQQTFSRIDQRHSGTKFNLLSQTGRLSRCSQTPAKFQSDGVYRSHVVTVGRQGFVRVCVIVIRSYTFINKALRHRILWWTKYIKIFLFQSWTITWYELCLIMLNITKITKYLIKLISGTKNIHIHLHKYKNITMNIFIFMMQQYLS